MQFHPNELFLLYDPRSSSGKQTKALASDFCSHINEVDVVNEKLSPTYWKEIVSMANVEPQTLLDKSHADYQKVAGNNYTMNGWLDVLTHYPHLVKGAIVIFNGKAVHCQTPTDIFKLGPRKEAEKILPHLKKYQG